MFLTVNVCTLFLGKPLIKNVEMEGSQVLYLNCLLQILLLTVSALTCSRAELLYTYCHSPSGFLQKLLSKRILHIYSYRYSHTHGLFVKSSRIYLREFEESEEQEKIEFEVGKVVVDLTFYLLFVLGQVSLYFFELNLVLFLLLFLLLLYQGLN